MRILIADDNHFYRTALRAALVEWGYEVVAVSDGQEAWEVLSADDAPKLALLDWVMPKVDGLEVCRRLRRLPRHEPTYLIVLTSKNGKADAVAALDAGADDFVTKPFDRDELRARIQAGRRVVGLQTSAAVVYAFARAVDAKSAYTRGHSDRVTRYALALADRVGVSDAERETVRRGGLLHDIGKICVPDDILNKPGPLTPAEFDVVRRHSAQGAQMLEPLDSVRDVIPLVRWHHERLDGRGYPDGLAGGQIPRLVRVLSVADVYDAVRSDRPYRVGMPHDRCLAVLRDGASNGGLDRELVEAFCGLGAEVFDPCATPPPLAPMQFPSPAAAALS